MTTHTLGTHDEWLAARLDLLKAEKELTRRSDELARQAARSALGAARGGLPVHDRRRRCIARATCSAGARRCSSTTSCSTRTGTRVVRAARRVADGFAGSIAHFEHHDVAFVVVSRAPLEKLVAYRRRMGWDFRWVSSFGSSFNYDFHATIDPAVAPVEYNYRDQAQLEADNIAWRDWSGEQPGMSAFAREGDEVFHTYSAYARGFDATVADVAVARPRAARSQRRRPVVVPSPRRVHLIHEREEPVMQTPPIVSPEEWEAAREQLLVKEKELTRARDALAAERRRMPWLAVEKEYEFDGPDGEGEPARSVRRAPSADRLPRVLRARRGRLARARLHRLLDGGRPGRPRRAPERAATRRWCSSRARRRPTIERLQGADGLGDARGSR